MAVGAQQDAHFIFGFHQMRLVDGLSEQPDPVVASVGFEVAVDGDHDEVVLGVAEYATQRLGHAHNLIRGALNGDGLSHGVDAREKARANVVTNEGYGRVAADFLISNAAAGVQLDIVNGRNGFGDALNIHRFLGGALIGNAGLSGSHHAQVS